MDVIEMVFDKRAFNKQWRKDHPESVRESKRKWNQKNKLRTRETHREWQQKNRDKVYAENRKWVEKNKNNPTYRLKKHARLISRRTKLPIDGCTKCGSKEHLQRHHLDYEKPLEIMPLCQACHKELHMDGRD